jgi:hypothetical protein
MKLATAEEMEQFLKPQKKIKTKVLKIKLLKMDTKLIIQKMSQKKKRKLNLS